MKDSIILPSWLNPLKFEDLVRLGNTNDGGYVVRKQDINDAGNLISLGISFDWSFEKEFKKQNKKIKVNTYDGSIGFKYFLKNCKFRLKNFLLNPNKKNFDKLITRLKLFLNFSIFFKLNLFNKIKHCEKFVASDLSKFINFEKLYGYKPKLIEIKEILLNELNNVFLSIDIEGEEYNLLDEICEYDENLIALNIEFHDVDKNIDKIEKFLKKFNLILIHTHINNFGPIVNNIPSVIELSFSRNIENSSIKNYALTDHLPIDLDQPNKINGPDYSVTFK